MNNNIITAVFGALRETKVRPRYRYDQGQVLVVKGVPNLPDFFEVHFSNEGDSADATPLIGTPDGVTIPDSYFQSGKTVLAYIYVHDEATDGTTVYKVTIPIINRARPANIDPDPEQADIIAQAIVALNENVGKSEAAAEAAETAQQGAEAARDAAGTSAEAAAESAQQSAQSAQSAAQSASAAAGSASAAAQSATEAAASAGQSAQSASDAQTYAETASDKALEASQSASAASTAAGTATTKATEASTSASNAASSASAAATSESNAADSATAAGASASTANTKAGEAASSASAAAQSATAAGNAQSAAEAAQEGAETAAESVESSAAQISQNKNDIADLKSALTHFLSLDSDDATVIPANSDFNDYTTPGNYKVTSISVSKTIANIPYETNGRLTVARTTSDNRIMQIYWLNSNIISIYYRFCMGSSWSAWTQLANDVTINSKVALATIRDIYPHSNNSVKFARSGTSIIATIPRGLAHYLDANGNMHESSINNSGETEITVPHDSFAIYSFTDSAIEVKTLAELRTLANNSYMPLFYNSAGNVRGLWEKYAIQQNINYQGEVYFYGNKTYPTFHVLDDYSIDVTIPSNARVNYYNLSVSPPLFKNGISTNISAQTINVPHDKCLVYDVSTGHLSVENNNFNYDHNKTVLFYNSHGIANGQWYRYYLRQLNEESQNGYPAYFRTHLTERIDTINTMLAAQGASAMLFITDHHYPSNNLKSVGIVETVCKEAGIIKVFLGGDYINRENLKAEALRNINRIGRMYLYPGVKTFRLCGNHEFNNPGASTDPTIVANQLTSAELRHTILNTFISDVTVDANSLSYYYDDDINKIRYIVGSVKHTSALDANSVAWVCDQLTQVPSGWSAVVLFHTILKYADGVTSPINSAANLINVLDAFKQKNSYTFGGVTYDFSSTGAELICAICADMHVDTDYTTSGGVHIIATTTDSLQELGELTRTVGDISEIAFDVFVFNTSQKTIDCVRFGAGNSRSFSY